MTPAVPKLTERALQAQLTKLFTTAGCLCFSTSQGFRKEPGGTRMTPGIPDLYLFLPPYKVECEETTGFILPRIFMPGIACGWFEVKTPAGLVLHRHGVARGEKRARGQEAFGQRCRERGIPYGIGGLAEAYAFLESVGLARRTGTAHHPTHPELATPVYLLTTRTDLPVPRTYTGAAR